MNVILKCKTLCIYSNLFNVAYENYYQIKYKYIDRRVKNNMNLFILMIKISEYF